MHVTPRKRSCYLFRSRVEFYKGSKRNELDLFSCCIWFAGWVALRCEHDEGTGDRVGVREWMVERGMVEIR